MAYLVIFWGLLYFGFILWLIAGWRNSFNHFQDIVNTFTKESIKHPDLTVTVVVPVRNEAENLPRLLADLLVQDYPLHLLQVIIVDDDSTDQTLDQARQIAATQDGRFQVLTASDLDRVELLPALIPSTFQSEVIKAGMINSPKKRAILAAVCTTNADVILTTDGDCRVPPTWVSTMVKPLAMGAAIAVAGPVRLVGKSLFAQMQAMEFGSLVVTGAATLGHGYPSMCNGANLAWLKSAFIAVGGYGESSLQPSGDDEFLWHRLAARFPQQLVFAATPQARVVTGAAPDMSAFVQQRTRWASKWNLHSQKSINKYLASGLAIWYLGVLLMVNFTVAGYLSWAQLAVFFSNKLLADVLLLLPIYPQIGLKFRLLPFLLVGLLYPFYAAYFAIRVLIAPSYNWKGRTW